MRFYLNIFTIKLNRKEVIVRSYEKITALYERLSRERKRALKRLPPFCSGFTKNIPLWYLEMERLGN